MLIVDLTLTPVAFRPKIGMNLFQLENSYFLNFKAN